MNRGRHKKTPFPYEKEVFLKIFYFNNHPKVQRKICVEDYKIFLNEYHLNWYIVHNMNDPYSHILEIQIQYNQKVIRVYKRYQFHNKTI